VRFIRSSKACDFRPAAARVEFCKTARLAGLHVIGAPRGKASSAGIVSFTS
jgi:hypothetical protein